MRQIRALPTRYGGVMFRSRLEARWALFFDALGIWWEYEPEGFKLPSGECYLPDFWLPTFSGGMYAEVKPSGGDFTKARELVQASGRKLWCCDGPPDCRAYAVLQVDPITAVVASSWAVPNWDQAQGEDRMFWCPGCEDEHGNISEFDFLDGDPTGIIPAAVSAAWSAKFGT